MNGEVIDGPLFDAAGSVLAVHELKIGALDWYELNRSRRIDVSKDFKTGKVSITVYGLPYDMPIDVFQDLLDNAIRFTIKGQKGTEVKPSTRAWVVNYRRTVA